MSVQHTNRQAKLNRQQMTKQYQEQHSLHLSGRNLEDELIIAEHRIALLDEELAATLKELQAAQKELVETQTRCTEAEAEAAKQGKRADSNHEYMMGCFHQMQEARAAHNKLSQIVRLALTPTQYHDYRERIKEES